VLAAYRAGIFEVVPEENRKDLEEIAEDVRAEMSFVFVGHMDQVLATALLRELGAPVGETASEADGSHPSLPMAH
jgi:ATP-dependent Lon protease